MRGWGGGTRGAGACERRSERGWRGRGGEGMLALGRMLSGRLSGWVLEGLW